VINMRPVSMFANGPGGEIEQLEADLHGRWRQAARAVMVLLSARGLPPAQIAALLDCHPATVRRWIRRFNDEGAAGLADRPPCGRPRLGGQRLTGRIAALLARPGRGPCRGSAGTWAGRSSACAPCTGRSGWWQYGGGPS
jgi:Homeodomain-like domain-containing protein